MKGHLNMYLKFYDIDMKKFLLPVVIKYDSDYYSSLKND